MKTKLDIAIEAAKKGGAHALTYFQTNLTIEMKANNSPVTIADRETEAVIKTAILAEDPTANFVGEETGGSFDQDAYWLIDPIDGTACFVHGIPLWGVLISYIEHGEATVGVSYVPSQNELMYAEKGKGAFLNDKPIHVSQTSRIQDAFFTHGTLYKIIDRLPGFLEFTKQTFKVRGMGDCFGYHLLATGRTEGIFDGGLSPWDLAGLKLIVEESGGKITNFKGEPWTFSDNNAIVTNGLVHEEVLHLVHNEP